MLLFGGGAPSTPRTLATMRLRPRPRLRARARDRSLDRKLLSLRCDPEQYSTLLWPPVTCNHSCIRQELACYPRDHRETEETSTRRDSESLPFFYLRKGDCLKVSTDNWLSQKGQTYIYSLPHTIPKQQQRRGPQDRLPFLFSFRFDLPSVAFNIQKILYSLSFGPLRAPSPIPLCS